MHWMITRLKGTVSVILEAMFESQLYRWNLNLIKNVKIPSFFWLEKCLFLWVSPLLFKNKKQVTVAEKPQIKINREEKKHWYLIHTWSDKAFKGTVVNKVVSSLQWGSLEISLSVNLNSNFIIKYLYNIMFVNPRYFKHWLQDLLFEISDKGPNLMNLKCLPPVQIWITLQILPIKSLTLNRWFKC